MNRALRVGRVAPLIVEILNRLAVTNLGEHFRVVGTHALYACEPAAGVTVHDEAVATRDLLQSRAVDDVVRDYLPQWAKN